MRRALSSCSNVSSIPRVFAPPQPKHTFVGLGSSSISLNESNARWRVVSRASLTLAYFKLQEFAERLHPFGDAFLVEPCESKPQSIGLRILQIEISAGDEHHAAFAEMNQKFAGIEARGQSNPHRHSALGTRPSSFSWHIFLKRGFDCFQPSAINSLHLR